jgi:hypothetical protein
VLKTLPCHFKVSESTERKILTGLVYRSDAESWFAVLARPKSLAMAMKQGLGNGMVNSAASFFRKESLEQTDVVISSTLKLAKQITESMQSDFVITTSDHLAAVAVPARMHCYVLIEGA